MDQTYSIIAWQTLFTWLWRWLLLRLSKRQSPTTVLFRTTLTRTITVHDLRSIVFYWQIWWHLCDNPHLASLFFDLDFWKLQDFLIIYVFFFSSTNLWHEYAQEVPCIYNLKMTLKSSRPLWKFQFLSIHSGYWWSRSWLSYLSATVFIAQGCR